METSPCKNVYILGGNEDIAFTDYALLHPLEKSTAWQMPCVSFLAVLVGSVKSVYLLFLNQQKGCYWLEGSRGISGILKLCVFPPFLPLVCIMLVTPVK